MNTRERKGGRPRKFDEHAAIAEATTAFWRKGYSGSSLDDLTSAMGLNRPSLYNAFGDKHALYETALKQYIEASAVALEELLAKSALPAALGAVYGAALDLYLSPEECARGCFLISTATVESAQDEAVRNLLATGLHTFDAAFERRFKHAIKRGEIDRMEDAHGLAKMAAAVLHSLAVRARAGEPRASLEAMAARAVAALTR